MKKSRLVWTALATLLVVGGAVGIQQYRHSAALDAEAATLSDAMRLDPLDGKPAPNFALTDEHGKNISLADFKDKVVVVQFMDPVCTDICPVVSAEIVGADKILAEKQSNVVFITVNVNQYHESQSDLLQFSKQHGLDALPNWYFVTGKTSDLQAVWKAYGITVVPNPSGDVQHSSFMFFLDRNGKERYIANPDNSKASIPQWSKGIAFFINKLI